MTSLTAGDSAWPFYVCRPTHWGYGVRVDEILCTPVEAVGIFLSLLMYMLH